MNEYNIFEIVKFNKNQAKHANIKQEQRKPHISLYCTVTLWASSHLNMTRPLKLKHRISE